MARTSAQSATNGDIADAVSSEAAAQAQAAPGSPGGENIPLDYGAGHGIARSQGGGVIDPSSDVNWGEYLTPDEARSLDSAVQQNVNATEILISRLAMMQPLSPEIKVRKAGYAEGMILDNNSREVYSVNSPPPWMLGKVPNPDSLEPVDFIRFVPIFKLPSEFIRWKARNTEGTGWWWKTIDPQEVVDIRPNMQAGTPLMRPAYRGTFAGGWKPEQNGPKAPPCTENINFLGLVIGPEGQVMSPPLILTFAKTSANSGKKLVSALQMHKIERIPYFGRYYYVYTNREMKNDNVYYIFDIAMGGKTPNDRHLISLAVEMARYLADPQEGKARQEAMIANSVDYDDEAGAHDAAAAASARAAGDGGYVPSEQHVQDAWADPSKPAGSQNTQHATAPLSGKPNF